jgi:hypothetical protein
VHFGAWHPISEASAAAPEAAGVLQARAEGAMDYVSGRSAMVMYASSGPEETLRAFVSGGGARRLARAVSAGARWIRFAEAPDPAQQLDRLLRLFVERFGSPPIGNAAAGQPSSAKNGGAGGGV